MTDIASWTYLMDLNGVLLRDEEHAVPGSAAFLSALRERDLPFMVFTNNSIHTPQGLRSQLLRRDLDVPEQRIWTSALATARFLDQQRPGGSAYVIGESGLTTALTDIGYELTDRDPDYVILGEIRTYSFESITTAIRLIERGARFLATNPDEKGRGEEGLLPATGAIAALIERVTRRSPYYVGKPNPLMMRSALRQLGAHSENTVVVGDRMDTDVKSGLESGMRTILVLSGLSDESAAVNFPYRPGKVINAVADIADHVQDPFRGAAAVDSPHSG